MSDVRKLDIDEILANASLTELSAESLKMSHPHFSLSTKALNAVKDIRLLSARCEELERRLTGAWVVMELEWREIGKSLFRANTPLGPVIINFCRDGWFVDSNDSGITATYPSLDAAKAAAQQWFHEKMTAGLRRVGG